MVIITEQGWTNRYPFHEGGNVGHSQSPGSRVSYRSLPKVMDKDTVLISGPSHCITGTERDDEGRASQQHHERMLSLSIPIASNLPLKATGKTVCREILAGLSVVTR